MKTVKKSSWFIFLVLLVVSCLDEPDCFQLNNNRVGISFRVIGTGKSDTTFLSHIDVGAIDSDFFADTASVFLLPLNYLASETDIALEGPNGYSEKLFLGYRVQTQFVSEDCGSRFVLSDLQVLEHSFDSVRIVNGVPTKAGAVNIEIYRCPNPDKMGISFRQLYATGLLKANKQSKFIGADLGDVTAGGTTLYAGGSAATIRLAVDTLTDRTDYTFNFLENKYAAEAKTLTVTYKAEVKTPYKRCPAKTYVSNLKVGTTTFDSVSLVVTTTDGIRDTLDNLTDPVQTNLYVYRCPDTNLFQVAFRQLTSSGSSYRSDTVLVQSIRADYTETIFYQQANLSYAQLPLNPAADETTFYINYGTTTDTLTVGYLRRNVTLFTRCGEKPVYSQLNLLNDAALTNINMLETDSVQYPSVSNLEIFH